MDYLQTRHFGKTRKLAYKQTPEVWKFDPGALRTNDMKSSFIDVFAFFVLFAFLNVVQAGISKVMLGNSSGHYFCEIIQGSPHKLITSHAFFNFVAPSFDWYDLWKYHSKPQHEQGSQSHVLLDSAAFVIFVISILASNIFGNFVLMFNSTQKV